MADRRLIRGYSEVAISRSGMRTDCEGHPYWGVCFRLDGDVRELFPYINGTFERARYGLRPHHVQFHYEGVRCTLYPEDATAAPFRDRDHVFAFIEQLVLLLNDLYDRRTELTPNHKVYHQPASVVEILKSLPKTNCGACGHPTCMAFAASLRSGAASPADCPDFARPIFTSTVYPVFGQDGTVVSTFAIESGSATGRRSVAPPEGETHGASPPAIRYDPHGIQIQQDLTRREIEVLRLVAEGASNPEISEALHISPHTVKSHIIHIFNKLSVNDRTQAAVWAVQNGVI
ncbi:MAG: LuxR C-terminal-related transcriptional regulator [Desulfosarcinaceae bacterium]|nr:LuxR C-terminal-related transcriptional regulator [Desulfosarcinaceae bacterium]